MNILIIEDDEVLAHQIAQVFDTKILSNRIRILHSSFDFVREVHLLKSYDIIITDLQLDCHTNELGGYRIIRTIRENHIQIPIIVISGIAELDILRQAFEYGASDYLIKPIRLKELELRVMNWFKQYQFIGLSLEGKRYRIYDLEYDLDKNEFYFLGNKIILTRMSKYVLSLFFSRPGNILSDAFLREKIWGDREMIVERNVRIVILRLKKSLTPHKIDHWICNIHGEGYIFQPGDLF